jgi:hypothetical protein
MNFLCRLCCYGKESREDKCKDEESDIPQVATAPTVSKSSSGIEEQDNPFSEYGLNSPPKGENPRTVPQALQLIKEDCFGKYLKAFDSNHSVDKNKARCLVFLYGRGFYLLAKEEKRKEKIEKILNKPEAIERVVRLLESEGADRDITVSQAGLYVRMCQTLHRYFQQKGSFGFLPNKNKAAIYYFRIQRQGNCFMHATCVMIVYLFQNRGLSECYPVDLSKFVRRSFIDKELYKYIVKDDGGRGLDYLEMMLDSLFERKPQISSHPSSLVGASDFDLADHLKKFGPGLVTGFDCNKHFKNEEPCENKDKIGYLQFQGKNHISRGKFVELSCQQGGDVADEQYKNSVEMTLETYKSSHNVPQELFASNDANTETIDTSTNGGVNAVVEVNASSEAIGRDRGRTQEESHAMVLIGGRRVKGKLWLLLQNWWDDMQLVEVDADYFAGCQATLSFVAQTKKEFADANLETFYTMNPSLVADSNNLDRADYAKSDGCFAVPHLDR